MTLEKKLEKAKKSNNIKIVNDVFEEIYYKYGNLVGYIISKYVNNKQDIEELINDVFINFSKVIYNISLDNIKYYLVTQAKNQAINFLKKKDNKIELVYEEEYIFSVRDNDNSLYYEIINDMKKVLNDDEINIIILHAVYDYSFVDIAKKYQRKVSTISSIYHRAIKKYNRRIKNDKM